MIDTIGFSSGRALRTRLQVDVGPREGASGEQEDEAGAPAHAVEHRRLRLGVRGERLVAAPHLVDRVAQDLRVQGWVQEWV